MLSPRKFNLLMAAAVAVAFVVMLWLYAYTGHMFPCMFKQITGFDCPGCGSQRALHALFAGNFHTALTVNLMLPPLLVYLLLVIVSSTPQIASGSMAARRLHQRLTSATAIAWLAVAIVAWTIVRNILNI